MDETANLKLPYILAAQSQKHVTHNEALRALDAIVQLAVADKDLSAPPESPDEGDRYIVGASPTGTWSGHAMHVAAWQDDAWAFYAPVAGWLAWVDDESQSYLFSGGGWIPAPGGGGASFVPKGAWSSVATYATGDLVEHDGHAFLSNIDDNLDNEPDAGTPGSTSEWTYFAVLAGGGGGGGGSVNPVSLVGVNATADATNRLAVASPASLFSHDGAGHQLKINKDAAGDTASVLFQTAFSGRAEFGLTGDDDFHVKVSPDGSTWHEAIVVNRSNGLTRVTGQREALTANRTYYVRTDGNDSNDGLSNAAGGAFLTIQKAISVVAALDISIYTVTIQLGDGTYTAGATVTAPWVGTGTVRLQGNQTTPSNVVISTTSGRPIVASGGARLSIRYLKMQASGSGISAIYVTSGARVLADGAIEFGGATYACVDCREGGQFVTPYGTGNITIAGGGAYAFYADTNSVISVRALTLTLTGTPAFSQMFFRCESGGVAFVDSWSITGSATGVRYSAVRGGGINTNGGGASYFPGDSAGSATSPGWYA